MRQIAVTIQATEAPSLTLIVNADDLEYVTDEQIEDALSEHVRLHRDDTVAKFIDHNGWTESDREVWA